MSKILVTGATGNVGKEVIEALGRLNTNDEIIAGTTNPNGIQKKVENITYRKIDFADSSSFRPALEEVDLVFLLRPPQLANIPKYFNPFIEEMKHSEVKGVVFLSVQGVENQPKIPHYKLEKLIETHGIPHVFLRPSYFMQNLSSTLLYNIKKADQIFIPAGNLPFTWVDAKDIGKVAAKVLVDFDTFKSQALEITGSEVKNFQDVAELMTEVLGRKINYVSPNLCHFFLKMKKQDIANPMIFVMIMLHYLPRFQKTTHKTTQIVKEITGKDPGLLKDFIIRNKNIFNSK